MGEYDYDIFSVGDDIPQRRAIRDTGIGGELVSSIRKPRKAKPQKERKLTINRSRHTRKVQSLSAESYIKREKISDDRVKELIRSDARADFISTLEFTNPEMAKTFAYVLSKALSHNLSKEADYIFALGKAAVDKSNKVKIFSQTVSSLLVPEFYGGTK